VWGLAESGVTTPAVQDAIDDGRAWLVRNQESGGAWTEQKSSSWRKIGTTSETTGYSLLALDATGMATSNETLTDGVSYLVGTYDSRGSFGYTRASAVAINALTELEQAGRKGDQTLTVQFDAPGGASVTKTIDVNKSEPHVNVELTDAELETLRKDTTAANPTVDVTVTGNGNGTVLVSIENEQVVNAAEYEANTGGS
jgi:hypothetical protein